MDAINRAIESAGGLRALGRDVGVCYQAIQRWRREGRIPAERVLAVEKASGVSRHELRPDLYPLDAPRRYARRSINALTT